MKFKCFSLRQAYFNEIKFLDIGDLTEADTMVSKIDSNVKEIYVAEGFKKIKE